MKGVVFKAVIVLEICAYYLSPVIADYEGLLKELHRKDFFQTLGPNALLYTYFNKSDSKILLDGKCLSDLNSYKRGLENEETWALKMMDSSSKVAPGLFVGNIIELGMYDECMSVRVNKNGSEIRGNHCTYTLHLSYENKTLPLNPLISICMPSSCKPKDINKMLQKRLQIIGGFEEFNVTRKEVHCSSAYPDLLTGFILTMIVGIAIFLLIIIFTIIDYRKEKIGLKTPQAWKALSMYRNILSIISFKDSPGSIPALHGLRSLSTAAIISGHSIYIRGIGVTINNLDLSNQPSYTNIWFGYVMYGVDTFFVISGFLMTYVFLKKYTSSEKTFNVGTYYLHRYIRLTPPILVLLLSAIYIGPFVGTGPRWQLMAKDWVSVSCEKKWWSYLLYINNLYDKETYCLPHLWSTATDMQLFWISPLILYPLAKKPKLGLSILGLLFITSIAIPATITFTQNLPFSVVERELSFHRIIASFNNIPGVPTAVFIGWITAIASFLFCTIGYWTLIKKDYEYDVIWESSFGASSRAIWGVMVAWIILASIRDCGGPITKFLSLPIFYPVSRLSYCIYLMHPAVQVLNVQTLKAPAYFDLHHLIINYINDFILSLFFAPLLSVIFEMPARSLENWFFSRRTPIQDSR